MDNSYKLAFGRTPLAYAAVRGHEAVMKLLAEHEDVEVDSKDEGSQTLLSYTAVGGHEVVVKVLQFSVAIPTRRGRGRGK